MKDMRILLLTMFVGTVIGAVVNADTIVGSKHDLSISGDPAKFDQVCIYCHTPHNANPKGPLWNRMDPDNPTRFMLYTSSPTLDVKPTGGVPSDISLLCLSCHDAVNLGGAWGWSNTHTLYNMPEGSSVFTSLDCSACHENGGATSHGWSTAEKKRAIIGIGANLTNDHPISINYPAAAQDPYFHVPEDEQNGWNSVKLYRGKVECASCHAVHDPANGYFLRTVNSGSTLCLKCHNK